MKRFGSISEFLAFRQMPQPEHPLICVFPVESVARTQMEESVTWMYDFYAIGLKHVQNAKKAKLKYGQQEYDFDNGIMSFVAPGQVMRLSFDDDAGSIEQSGWMLLVHPDFFWNTPVAQTVRRYDFWDYSLREALFLSEKEEMTLVQILQTIRQECHANIDRFTKGIIVSQVETLLNYADRFYHRQFVTREKAHHEVLERLEQLLNDAFRDDRLAEQGWPTVAGVATALNLSANYLSSLLRTLTGQNTQQHIHGKLIEKAKEKLSTTGLSVGEIAFELGFEHIQSFSKLFRSKTKQSPLEFRQTFQA